MDDKEFEETLASVKRELKDDEAVNQKRAPQQTHAKNTVRRSRNKRKMQRKKRLRVLLTGLAAVLLIVLIILAVKSCSGDTSLAGTWRIDDATVYEFDGKGSGVLHTSLNDYAFTYTVEDDTLRIDFASSAATDTTYQYSIKGNTLTFERGGETYKLTKD